MKIYITILFLLVSLKGFAQNIVLNGQASFFLGGSATFFAGGNTTFNGTVKNEGTIVSYQDLDFTGNQETGNVKFVGPDEQNLLGDTLVATDVEVDKPGGDLILQSDRLIVEGTLSVTNGVIEAAQEAELLVTGSSENETTGYVEGNLVGITSAGPTVFPMGLDGAANFITLSSNQPGAVVKVRCKVPDPDRLLPTEDMIGIADEMEWVLTANRDSLEVNVSATFSGIDLTSFSNGKFVRAHDYAPSLVKLGAGDTIYRDLGIEDLSDTDERTFGTIAAQESFFISREPTYLSVALIPLLLRPEFFVPNAFSPNAQLDQNKVFRPYFAGDEVSSIRIDVFDSFQNTLYTVSESGQNLDLWSFGWDGYLPDGQLADEGVYYYSIVLLAAGVEYKKSGSFLLTD